MTILKYLQLPFYFDAGLLQKEVNMLSGMIWQSHYQKLHYEGEWTALPLRSIDGKADHIIVSSEVHDTYRDTEFLECCPYIKKLLQSIKCPLMAVRLLKLNAGAVIKEHRDAELCFEKGEVRLHVPVKTHPDVEFYLDNERIELKEGECWYMNVNLPHRVANNSNTDRIHLVIDAKVNDWVKKVFDEQALYRKDITEPGYDEATKRQIILSLREMNTDTSNRMADEMEASCTVLK